MGTTVHSEEYAVLVALLRELRLKRGLTQEELAEQLGVEQSMISKVERRERRLDLVELSRVCDAMQIPLVDFVAAYEKALAGPRSKK